MQQKTTKSDDTDLVWRDVEVPKTVSDKRLACL